LVGPPIKIFSILSKIHPLISKASITTLSLEIQKYSSGLLGFKYIKTSLLSIIIVSINCFPKYNSLEISLLTLREE